MAFFVKMIPAKTSRLDFRFFTKEDFPLIEKLNSDPIVTTYLGGVKSPDEIEMNFRKYLTYHLQYPGYGYWGTFHKEKNLFVGFFLVKLLPETGETEIGYQLLPEFWGRGLATEGARALVDYVKVNLAVPKVVGVAAPENVGSRRVLEKIGLTFRKYGEYYQTRCAYYSLDLSQ